jgi:hypothetical protein
MKETDEENREERKCGKGVNYVSWREKTIVCRNIVQLLWRRIAMR